MIPGGPRDNDQAFQILYKGYKDRLDIVKYIKYADWNHANKYFLLKIHPDFQDALGGVATYIRRLTMQCFFSYPPPRTLPDLLRIIVKGIQHHAKGT